MTTDFASQTSRSFAFGPFVLLPERQLLLRDERHVRIGGRALDILTVLVERSGEVVTKTELLSSVWPDTTVDESNLKVNMAALRRVLESGPGGPKYIATVVGQGYRFVAPVERVGTKELPAADGTAPGPSHNLPLPTTNVYGRTETIAGIRGDLERSRLVSIVGAGGIGKTTVALAVAAETVDAFGDGAWLVDLTPLREPDRVPNAIAGALGLQAHSADMLGVVCEFLRDRQVLLVLDNCEHVLEGVVACADRILAKAAGVRILVTSREPLRTAKETIRRLAGLDTPPDATSPLDARGALDFAAVQLFVDRATESHGAFELTDANAPVVARICRRLDGLALAIELAATRVGTFGVTGLLRQLDDRFRLLTGWRTGPERHRTLAATLDWSYGLLEDHEASLLRAVSVFAGAFDLDGAAAVSGTTAVRALDALASLSAKSLLAVEPSGDGVACRLLETTRAYSVGRLRRSGEEAVVRGRHADFVLAMLDRAATDWDRRSARDWGATYGALVDDLRSAIAWAGTDAADASLLIRLTALGARLWNHFSLTEECRAHVLRAVQELDRADLVGTATEMQLQLVLSGATMYTQGCVPDVLVALQRSLTIAERLDDADHRLRSLRMIGSYQGFVGAYQAAMATFETFASVAKEHDPSALPDGETHLGITEVFSGRPASARRRLERLRRCESLGFDHSRLARFLYDRQVDIGNVLAYSQWLTGSPDTAAENAEVTVTHAMKTKHWLSLSNALAVGACPVFFMSHRYDECSRYAAMLDEQVRQHGIVIWSPTARFYRGALACARDPVAAGGIDDLEHALTEFRAINHWARMSWNLAVLADALARSGRLGEAELKSKEALDWGREHGEGWCLPEVLRIRASVFAAQDRMDEAEAMLVDAMTVARDTGGLSWQLRAGIDLVQLRRARRGVCNAREVLLPTFAAFTEGFATRDLMVAAALIAG